MLRVRISCPARRMNCFGLSESKREPPPAASTMACMRGLGSSARSMPIVASIVSSARSWVVLLTWYVARLLPQRERVVLATSNGTNLDGNLRCIAAEMRARKPPLPVVVFAYNKQAGVRRFVGDMVAAYHIGTARLFVVDDYFFATSVVGARPGSATVQVWHACGAFKNMGLSRHDRRTLMKRRAPDPAAFSRNYNMFLASSKRTAECYAEAFGQPLEKFVCDLGIPRTDILFGHEPSAQETIKRKLRIPTDRKVILYAPTFRGSVASARSPNNLDLPTLQRVLGRDHVVLLRRHPHARSATRLEPDLGGFVIDASDYPEVNELMLISDILVTDYSSVIFEFALLNRPIAMFAPDLPEHEADRGFYFDYRSEGPGPVFVTTAELADYIRAGEFDLDVVRRFREPWFDVADGHSSERFVDQIVVPALAGTKGQPSQRRAHRPVE
jgi:teichoic acid ribitol-phosphate primase